MNGYRACAARLGKAALMVMDILLGFGLIVTLSWGIGSLLGRSMADREDRTRIS